MVPSNLALKFQWLYNPQTCQCTGMQNVTGQNRNVTIYNRIKEDTTATNVSH